MNCNLQCDETCAADAPISILQLWENFVSALHILASQWENVRVHIEPDNADKFQKHQQCDQTFWTKNRPKLRPTKYTHENSKKCARQ
jgi:hypothetical protein